MFILSKVETSHILISIRLYFILTIWITEDGPQQSILCDCISKLWIWVGNTKKIIMKKSKSNGNGAFLDSPDPVPMYRLKPPSHSPCVPLTSPADELTLQSHKIDCCGPSSVIQIVKMKYNRIDIKMWLVSTLLKINIEILSSSGPKAVLFRLVTFSWSFWYKVLTNHYFL
jgi:hypothetical protein